MRLSLFLLVQILRSDIALSLLQENDIDVVHHSWCCSVIELQVTDRAKGLTAANS